MPRHYLYLMSPLLMAACGGGGGGKTDVIRAESNFSEVEWIWIKADNGI